MTDRQDQRVAAGGTATQSGRDTIIHTGLSPEDMKAIVETLADQLPRLAASAAAIVEVRLKSFEADIMKRFEEDKSAKREAFSDPDFQHVVVDAQRAYARTGDNETHATLVDLIAKRSEEKTGSRRAFTMNESIEVVSRLTRSEISELAFSFFMRATQNHTIGSIVAFASHVNVYINEFIDDIETAPQSYEYLAAQRCSNISMGSIGLIEIWRRVYPALFFNGFSESEVEEMKRDISPHVSELLVTSQFNPIHVQPRAMTLDVFLKLPRHATIKDEQVKLIWERAMANQAGEDAIIEKLAPLVPRLREIIAKWNDSPMKSIDLTAIGNAIGHARLTQIPAFGKPDLSQWIS